MDKDNELTVRKRVLIVWPKIPQMPQKISARNVCPSSLWVSVNYTYDCYADIKCGRNKSLILVKASNVDKTLNF